MADPERINKLKNRLNANRATSPFAIFDPEEMVDDQQDKKERIKKASRVNALGEVIRQLTDLVGGSAGGTIVPRNDAANLSYDFLNQLNNIDAETRDRMDYWKRFNIGQKQKNKQYQIEEARRKDQRDWQIDDREDQQKHSMKVQKMIAKRTLANAQARARAEQQQEQQKYKIWDEKTGTFIYPDATGIRRLYNALVKNKGYSDFQESDPNLSNQLFDRYDNPDIEDQYQFVMKHWPSVRHIVFGVPQPEPNPVNYNPQIGSASKATYQGPAPLSNEKVEEMRSQYMKDVETIKNDPDPNLSVQKKRQMIEELNKMSYFK